MTDKEQRALETVKDYAWWSAAAGLVVVPLLDLVAVSGVQLKMLVEVSKIYGVPFEENRVKAIVAALTGFAVPHALAFGTLGALFLAYPLVAPAMALFSGASAWAMGKVFIQHFESGGTFLDFEPERVKAYYREQLDEARARATPAEKEHKPARPRKRPTARRG